MGERENNFTLSFSADDRSLITVCADTGRLNGDYHMMKKLDMFSVSEYEITKEIWDAVHLWAKDNGYGDLSIGSGRKKQPVGNITWYDAVKFCNALSEFMGLEPCYYVNNSIYKNGCSDDVEEKSANGYRLPSSDEWEYACRGGTTTDYFWGDTFIPMPKNEYAWCGIASEHCITHEVGLLKPNPYGLYDMAGNVYEWCFDRYRGFFRVMMGGSVAIDAIPKSDFRTFTSPNYFCYETGMRVFSSDISAPDYEQRLKNSEFFGTHIEQTVNYRDMSKEALAKMLYEELGDSEDAAFVKEAADNPTQMLERFRDLFIKRLKETNVNASIHYAGEDLDSMKEEIMKYDYNISWFGRTDVKDSHHTIGKPTFLGLEYAKTGEERYWNKCMELYYSMLVRYKAEFDCLDDEMLIQKDKVEQSWDWNNGFETATRSSGLLSAFWNAVNFGCPKELLPIDIVAGVALIIMRDILYTMIKDGRINIFNQACHTSREMLKMTKIFSDFKISKTANEIACERLCNAFLTSTRKDGAPLEQSYMYNKAIVNTYNSIKAYIDDENILKKLHEITLLVEKYLVSAIIPTGGWPALSTAASTYPPDIKDEKLMAEHKKEILDTLSSDCWKDIKWNEKNRIENAILNGDKDAPRFKNVHFPYGGITVIRSGWTYTSEMVYFFSAPSGRGHAGANINEIQLWDFGMPMLVSGGAHSYSIREYSPESQHGIIDDIDRYQRSSLSHNTLTAGKNQKRLENGENNLKIDLENECGYKYYESEKFVYTEGVYADGYVDSDAGAHKRKIIYSAENKLLFVLDSITSEKEEVFTQSWNFMPKAKYIGGIGYKTVYDMWGYEDGEIKIKDNVIYTESDNAPNVFLYQFSENKIRYERKRGELNPAAGWFAPHIQSERVHKTDIRACFKASGEPSVLTVIDTSPDKKSQISETAGNGNCCELTLNSGDRIRVEFSGSFIRARFKDSEIVIDDNGESYISDNGKKSRISAPCGFSWQDKDGYSYPVYMYR